MFFSSPRSRTRPEGDCRIPLSLVIHAFMAHPHGRHGARHPGIASTATPLVAIAAVEGLVCDSVLTTRAHLGEVSRVIASTGLNARAVEVNVVGCATAVEALQKATVLSAGGIRVAVLIGADELVEGLGALMPAVARHAPLVVHVIEPGGEGARAGRDEMGPALGIGAGALISGTVQQATDLALAARRAAEDSELPFLHFVDAGSQPSDVALPERALVEEFLGPLPTPKPPTPAVARADAKRRERAFTARAPFALKSAMRALGEATGRPLGPVSRMSGNDIEEVIIAVGRGATVARPAVEQLRREGRRIGFVAVTSLQPFYGADIVKAVSSAHAVVVLEPLDLALAPAGPLATLIKAAFADAITWTPGYPGIGKVPPTISATIATLDRPMSEDDIRSLLAELEDGERARRVVVFGTADEDASPKLPIRPSAAGRGARLH